MILPKYLETEIRKYCKIRSIPIKNGIILAPYVREIENFVNARLKKDRVMTKLQEAEQSLHIGTIMRKITELKLDASPIEGYLMDGLVKEKLDKLCHQQFKIGTKTVDFAFPIAHLVVECDGREYHHTEVCQLERDQKRDKYLARKGWRVLHIEGLAIRRNIGLCMEKIKEALKPYIRANK